MSDKSEEIKETKYGRIVWEHNTFTTENILIFVSVLLVVILFVGLSPAMIFAVFIIMVKETLFSYILAILLSIFLIGAFLSYFFYHLKISTFIFSIRFTESHLIIKRRLFGIPRRFELSNLWQVEIWIVKDAGWFEIPSFDSWRAKVNITMMIRTIDHKEKTYSFLHIFHERLRFNWGRMNEIVSETRTNFENEFNNLAVLFPKIIKFGEEKQVPKKSKRPVVRLFSLIIAIVFVILFFMVMGPPLRINITNLISILIAVVCMIPIIYFMKRYKEKRDKMKEGLNDQEF